jgi:LysR family transcriptional regulator for metE and metH
MRDVSLKHLRIVAAIARTGKVLGAAELLNVTPPAITLQLKQLEEILRLPVFERSRDGMKLTEAGRILLDGATRIEAELAACGEALNAMRGLTGGSVSIGVVSTAKYFAPAALGAFRREHPDLDLKLFVGNREDTIRGLAALEFDIVIMGRPPEGLDVKSAVLGENPHVIIARPDHPLAGKRRVTMADLGQEKFLMREPGSGTRGLMERIFARSRHQPKIGMEISSNETIKQAVMAGLGIAFLSAHTVAAEIETGRLVILNVEGLPAWRQWRVVRHAAKRLTPPGAALWDFLQQQGSRHLPALDLVKDEAGPVWTEWDAA